MSTTLARAGGTVPVLRVLGASAGWIGAVAVLAIVGAAVATRRRLGRRLTTLAWVLAASVFLAPLGQARIHTNFSLFKHVGFGAWFACIVAGYGLAAVARAVQARQAEYTRAAGLVLVFLLGISGAVLSSRQFAAWPDSARMSRGLAPVIQRTGCPCLIAENDVVHYYLAKQVTQDAFTTVFVMKYRDNGRELSGAAAYRAAIGLRLLRRNRPGGNPRPLCAGRGRTLGVALPARARHPLERARRALRDLGARPRGIGTGHAR